MQKVLLLVAIVGIAGMNGLAQTKEHFTVQDDGSCEKVYFKLNGRFWHLRNSYTKR